MILLSIKILSVTNSFQVLCEGKYCFLAIARGLAFFFTVEACHNLTSCRGNMTSSFWLRAEGPEELILSHVKGLVMLDELVLILAKPNSSIRFLPSVNPH